MTSHFSWKSSRLALLAAGLITSAILIGCGKSDTPATDKESPSTEATDSTPSAGGEAEPAGADTQPAATDAASQDAAAGTDASAVAIQVNDQVVTQGEFDDELQQQMTRLEQQLGGGQQSPEIVAQLSQIRQHMKQQMVDQKVMQLLLEDYLAKATMEVTPEEIEKQWTEIASQFPDEATLNQTLQREGMTVADAKQQVAQQVKLDKLMKQELGESEVTDAEAKAHFDAHPDDYSEPTQVRARHILIKTKEGDKEAIEAIHKRILAGEDFATLAKENSDCPSSEQGGDLGFFEKGRMVPAFADAAFALNVGEVSKPVQTEFGYHIIKVEERKEAGNREFAEVKEDIKQQMKQEKTHDSLGQFMDRLKKAAKITINIEMPPEQPVMGPDGFLPGDAGNVPADTPAETPADPPAETPEAAPADGADAPATEPDSGSPATPDPGAAPAPAGME